MTKRTRRRRQRRLEYVQRLQERLERADEDRCWDHRKLDVLHAMMLRAETLRAEAAELDHRLWGDALLLAMVGMQPVVTVGLVTR